MIKVSQDDVKKYFQYDGKNLLWKEKTSKYSRVKIGSIAGAISGEGYREIEIFGRGYKAHRLIWLYSTGSWPEDQIDHINHIRDDNRLENLRSVSERQNHRNQKLKKTNKSGVCGVFWYQPLSKWAAYIRAHGKKKHLGYFDELSDAASARNSAEREHGYHENHGLRASEVLI